MHFHQLYGSYDSYELTTPFSHNSTYTGLVSWMRCTFTTKHFMLFNLKDLKSISFTTSTLSGMNNESCFTTRTGSVNESYHLNYFSRLEQWWVSENLQFLREKFTKQQQLQIMLLKMWLFFIVVCKIDKRFFFFRLSQDGVTLRCWSRRFDRYYCKSSSGDEVDWLRVAYVARWLVAIGAFWSSLLFQQDVVPSPVRFDIGRQLCSLIVGIHA